MGTSERRGRLLKGVGVEIWERGEDVGGLALGILKEVDGVREGAREGGREF